VSRLVQVLDRKVGQIDAWLPTQQTSDSRSCNDVASAVSISLHAEVVSRHDEASLDMCPWSPGVMFVECLAGHCLDCVSSSLKWFWEDYHEYKQSRTDVAVIDSQGASLP
jgi:hypothetical protein